MNYYALENELYYLHGRYTSALMKGDRETTKALAEEIKKIQDKMEEIEEGLGL